MCLTCKCYLPANDHRDKRNVTYQVYKQHGNTMTHQELVDSTKTTRGLASARAAQASVTETLGKIRSGSISPTKR